MAPITYLEDICKHFQIQSSIIYYYYHTENSILFEIVCNLNKIVRSLLKLTVKRVCARRFSYATPSIILHNITIIPFCAWVDQCKR